MKTSVHITRLKESTITEWHTAHRERAELSIVSSKKERTVSGKFL